MVAAAGWETEWFRDMQAASMCVQFQLCEWRAHLLACLHSPVLNKATAWCQAVVQGLRTPDLECSVVNIFVTSASKFLLHQIKELQ